MKTPDKLPRSKIRHNVYAGMILAGTGRTKVMRPRNSNRRPKDAKNRPEKEWE